MASTPSHLRPQLPACRRPGRRYRVCPLPPQEAFQSAYSSFTAHPGHMYSSAVAPYAAPVPEGNKYAEGIGVSTLALAWVGHEHARHCIAGWVVLLRKVWHGTWAVRALGGQGEELPQGLLCAVVHYWSSGLSAVSKGPACQKR